MYGEKQYAFKILCSIVVLGVLVFLVNKYYYKFIITNGLEKYNLAVIITSFICETISIYIAVGSKVKKNILFFISLQ